MQDWTKTELKGAKRSTYDIVKYASAGLDHLLMSNF